MKRSASAVWTGGLKDGSGSVSSESGALSRTPYTFRMRFADEKGTNPEELVAAAHAACFSMFLAMVLENAGLTAQDIQTTATVSLEQLAGGFTVTSSALETRVKIPRRDEAEFQKAAETAKRECPISKLLNAQVTLAATLT